MFFGLLLIVLCIAIFPLVLEPEEKSKRKKENDIIIINKNEIQEKFLPPTPKFTSKDIRNMNPRDFEVFIANIFSDNGYSTKVTQYTSDGGKDIIIKKLCGVQTLGERSWKTRTTKISWCCCW